MIENKKQVSIKTFIQALKINGLTRKAILLAYKKDNNLKTNLEWDKELVNRNFYPKTLVKSKAKTSTNVDK